MVQGACNRTSYKPNPTEVQNSSSQQSAPHGIGKKKPPEGGFFLLTKEKLLL
jgi:hypothetical protein